MTVDNKKVIGVAALCVALTQLGNFTKGAGRVVGAVDVAYAAKDQAEIVDQKFQSYLDSQKAVADALTKYVQQQVPNQAASVQRPLQQSVQPAVPPPPDPPISWIVHDPTGPPYCTDGQTSWWPNDNGACD